METFKPEDVLSKHFLYQPHLILSSKRILTITQKGLVLDSLPFQFDQREYVGFEDLREMKLSEKKGLYREFSLRVERKSSQSLLIFQSYDRQAVVTSLYRAWDQFLYLEKHPEASLFTELDGIFMDGLNDAKNNEEVRLILFRTGLRVEFVPSPPLREPLTPHTINNLDITSKEDSSPQSPLLTSKESQQGMQHFWLNYSTVCQIRKTQSGFDLINCSNRIPIIFNTYDPEKTTLIVEKIRDHAANFIETKLEIIEEESPKNEKNIENLLLQQYCLINAYKLSPSRNAFRKVTLGLSEKQLIEIVPEEKRVLHRYELTSFHSLIRHDFDYYGLEIVDKDLHSIQFLMCASKRDIFLNNLMHLLELNGTKVNFNFLHSELPAFNLKVLGFPNENPDPEYESELLKRLCVAKTLDETHILAQEFSVNANCSRLSESDPKAYQYLHQTLMRLLSSLNRPETSQLTETYFQWLYQKNLRPELGLCELENGEVLQQLKERIMQLLQEEQKTFGDNEDAGLLGNNSGNANVGSLSSLRGLVDLMRKVEELIKALIISSRCNGFFSDIGTYKKDDFYEKSLALVVGLNDSSNELLAYLGTNLMRSFVQYDPFSDKKHEMFNKALMINKKPILLKKLVESIAYKTLFGSKNQESHYSLSLKSTLELFESLFITHKESTGPEELTLIFKVLTSKIVVAATANLCRCESYALLLKSTVVFNHLFKLSEGIRASYKELQAMFMNSTCLILLHMFHGVSSINSKQRAESVTFFSHMLSDNQAACSLLIRLIPKCLLSRVPTTQNDISKWGASHWSQFFDTLRQNLNTPTEQWNDACRKELLFKLKKADEEYFRKRRDVTEKEIALNNNDINIPESKLLSLKWNHEEFSIEYEALKTRYLVWKYYLACLIRDREEPILTIAITQPLRLWNELGYAFISSLDSGEREKVLKAMILLYRHHYHHIRELNAIPYWVHLLRLEEYTAHRYLILQLLYCSFTREENAVNKLNIKKLFESQGVEALFELLSGLHFEANEEPKPYEHPVYNFTEAKFLPSPAENAVQEKVNSVLLILNILDLLLKKQPPLDSLDREVFPHPFIKTVCSKEIHLEVLINTLLMPNEFIHAVVFSILKTHFMDRVSYKEVLKSRAFFEVLLSKLNENTIKDIMELVILLYQRVSEDPEMPNYIGVFLGFDFEQLDHQVIAESLDFFRFLKFFPKNLIWRLLNQGYEEFARVFFEEKFEEPNLIWTRGMREKVFALILQHLDPFIRDLLIYSRRYRVYRLEKLPRFNNPIIGEIIHENIEKEVKCGPLFLRVWNLRTQKHFYIEEEQINKFLALLGENLAVAVLNKNSEEIVALKQQDLLTLLHSHSKAIKRYEIHQYTSFSEVIVILQHFSQLYSVPNNLKEGFLNPEAALNIKFLSHGLRLVHRAVRLSGSGNLELFIQRQGVQALFAALRALVTKIFQTRKSPENVYYRQNVNATAQDLVGLCLAIKILKLLLQSARQELTELDPAQFLELVILLQKASKLPLVYFEFIKGRKRRPELKIDLEHEEPPIKSRNSVEPAETRNLFEGLWDEVPLEENPVEPQEKKLFFLMNDLVSLWVTFSVEAPLLDSLIRAGVLWRCLEFALLFEENFEVGGFDFEKTQRINEVSEDCVLVLRNVAIFANEVFLLKNTSYAEAPGYLDKLPVAKQKSEFLFNEVGRLHKKRKDVLRSFHEGLQVLLLRKSLQGLLEDYYEALIKPEEKDKRGIKKFLKLLNGDLEEETFIWMSENREDLKDVLKLQIALINEDPPKGFIEKIIDYQYGNHLNELQIEGVFVRIFNKNCSKLSDFPRFLKQLFYEIYARVKALDEGLSFVPPNTNSQRLLKGKTFDVKRAIEAVKAISTVLKNAGLHNIVLEKTNFDILVRLLADSEKWFQEMRSYLTTLQLEIYNILESLLSNTQEVLTLISNKSLMRTFFRQLKSNLRTDNVVIERLLKILGSLSLQGHYFKILGRYGFAFVFFEIALKNEIVSKSNRITAFKLLLKLHGDNEFLNQESFYLCLELFPLEIRQIINENMNVSEFIDSLDLTIDTPYFIWRKEMRQEIWKIVSEVNDEILREIDEFDQPHISMDSNTLIIKRYKEFIRNPEFPTLENEITVREIYIRNFNKFPNFNIKINLAIFIEEIASRAQQIFAAYFPLLKEQDSKTKLPKAQIKILDRNFCSFLTLISGLLLSIEQFTYNKTNPQIAFTTSSFVMLNAEDSHYSENGQKPLENSKFISEEALTNVIKWTELWNLDSTPLSIKSTLLQIAFLISELERGMLLLKSSGVIRVLTKFFKKYAHLEEEDPKEGDESKLTHVEESLVLNLILKILLNDNKLLGDFIQAGGLDLFLQIMELGDAKKHLDDVIMNTFSYAIKDIQCCDIVEEALRKKAYIEIEELKRMKPVDYRFINLWRVFKITETFANDPEKTLEYYQKRKQGSFLFPLISKIAYETLPHPETEINKKIKSINSFVSNALSTFDKNERLLIEEMEGSQDML